MHYLLNLPFFEIIVYDLFNFESFLIGKTLLNSVIVCTIYSDKMPFFLLVDTFPKFAQNSLERCSSRISKVFANSEAFGVKRQKTYLFNIKGQF